MLRAVSDKGSRVMRPTHSGWSPDKALKVPATNASVKAGIFSVIMADVSSRGVDHVPPRPINRIATTECESAAN